jgi:hypothetical protein
MARHLNDVGSPRRFIFSNWFADRNERAQRVDRRACATQSLRNGSRSARDWIRLTGLDLGIGVDNLVHTDRTRLRVRFSVINLTNKDALYNFLSTFSGTHFGTPRAYQLQVGVTF